MKLRIKVRALCAFFAVILAGMSIYAYLYPPRGVTVLAYHMVNDGTSDYSVSAQEFEDQLSYLQKEGYTTISLLDFAKAKKGKLTLPEKPLVITFDDGYVDNYTTALPLLEKYSMKATVFMVVNEINRGRYLSLAQLKDMEQRGIELGSHTANHLPLVDLSSDKKKEEVEISKLLMEWKGLRTIFFLAYPNGKYDDECRQYLKDTNYLGAMTGEAGINTFDTDPYVLHRINVPNPTFGLFEFKLRLFKAAFMTKFAIGQN